MELLLETKSIKLIKFLSSGGQVYYLLDRLEHMYIDRCTINSL